MICMYSGAAPNLCFSGTIRKLSNQRKAIPCVESMKVIFEFWACVRPQNM